jgi:DNA-binding beta-propeller fold protein YncE
MSRRQITLAVLVVAAWAGPVHALCGDGTGEGYITASDGLATLTTAVAGGYDSKLDVATVGAPDGRVTATDAFAILAAAVAPLVPDCAAADERAAIVSAASCDFATGGLAVVDLDDFTVLEHVVGSVEPDSVVRRQDERVFVVNRYSGSSVQEIDPADSLKTLWRCSVGAGSNPHDIVLLAPDKAYVTRYDATSIAVVDPSVGKSCEGFVRGYIDLSPWADADGIPEMDQMVQIGDRVFVAVQRLNRDNFFRPATNGALVVIDAVADAAVGAIELALTNPFTETKGLVYDAARERILVGGPGTLFSDLDDGGIEAVDPASLTSLGVLLSGADLGGDLGDFAMVGSRRGYAIVAAENFEASVVEFDLDAGIEGPPLMTSPLLISDVEVTEDGHLWVVDRDCFDPGLRVFDLGGNSEITSQPIYPGLTPFTLDFIR